MLRDSGTYASPSLQIACADLPGDVLRRRTRCVPALGFTTPAIADASDDLPAPFAPSTVVTDPARHVERHAEQRARLAVRDLEVGDPEQRSALGAATAVMARLRRRVRHAGVAADFVDRRTEVGRLHLGAVADLVGRALGEHPAEVEHRDAVREARARTPRCARRARTRCRGPGAPGAARRRAARSRARRGPTTARRAASPVGSDASARADLDEAPGAERHRHRRPVGDRVEPEQREDLARPPRPRRVRAARPSR